MSYLLFTVERTVCKEISKQHRCFSSLTVSGMVIQLVSVLLDIYIN